MPPESSSGKRSSNPCKPTRSDYLIGTLGALRLGQARKLERESHIISNVAPRKKIVLLRHVSDRCVDGETSAPL
jgi:hypothetical protein